MRGQAQSNANCRLALISLNRSKQLRYLWRFHDGRVMLYLWRDEGSLQVVSDIPLCSTRRDRIADDVAAGTSKATRGFIPATYLDRSEHLEKFWRGNLADRPSASIFFTHSSATILKVSPAETKPTPRVSLR